MITGSYKATAGTGSGAGAGAKNFLKVGASAKTNSFDSATLQTRLGSIPPPPLLIFVRLKFNLPPCQLRTDQILSFYCANLNKVRFHYSTLLIRARLHFIGPHCQYRQVRVLSFTPG